MRLASFPGVPARKINLLNGGADATRRLEPFARGHCALGKDAEGVSVETFTWKPAPDRWSIAEVLKHLLGIDGVYTARAQRMLIEESPKFEKYDPAAASSETHSLRHSGEDDLVAFVEARGGTVAFLSMLPPSAGQRSAQHAEIGKFTLSEMLHEWANHDLGHLRQIAELFRAREFYLYAGSFQKYSNPKP